MNYGLRHYDFKEIHIGNEPGVFVASDVIKPLKVESGIPESQNLQDTAFVNTSLKCSKDDTIKMLLSENEKITADYQMKEQLTAPVKSNTEIGKVTYYLNGKPLREYPIITTQNIEKLDFSWCLDKIWGWFAA